MKKNMDTTVTGTKSGKKNPGLKSDAKNKKIAPKKALVPETEDESMEKLKNAIAYLEKIGFDIDKEIQRQNIVKGMPYKDDIQEALVRIGKTDTDEARKSKAKALIVVSNGRLVSNILKNFRLSKEDYEDLLQQGNMGLIKAFDDFNFDRGVKYCTYATLIARSIMLKYKREQLNNLLSLTDHAGRDSEKIKRFISDYKARYGIEPDISDIAQELGISEDDVNLLQRTIRTSKYKSIYTSDGDQQEIDLTEKITIPEEEYSVENIAIANMMQDDVRRAVETLNETDKNILSDKFGIGTTEKSAVEMAKKYDTSKTSILFATCNAMDHALEDTRLWELYDYIV